MLILFESPAGFAVFKLLDEKKIKKVDNLYLEFENASKASKIVQLHSFKKFADCNEALLASSSIIEGKIGKPLRKFLKKLLKNDLVNEKLAVSDSKLGNLIKEKLKIPCVHNSQVLELMRGIRSQLQGLLGEKKDLAAMTLGLAHNLARYTLKFSSEKVDTMIIQGISLLDDIDKELNGYCMRCREWYGWHFPELSPFIPEHINYAKCVLCIGIKSNAVNVGDKLKEFLEQEVIDKIKKAATLSMGVDISVEDVENINFMAEQVISISEYRSNLFEYLKNRIMAIAPNIAILLGELVAARLIAHAGSLLSLAKAPASSLQIYGAEKAMFNALKTRKNTPKYGLIFHASLVNGVPVHLKGKAARMVAAKASLATRIDALRDSEIQESFAFSARSSLEIRLKALESGRSSMRSSSFKPSASIAPYIKIKDSSQSYDDRKDSTLVPEKKKRKKSTLYQQNHDGVAANSPDVNPRVKRLR